MERYNFRPALIMRNQGFSHPYAAALTVHKKNRSNPQSPIPLALMTQSGFGATLVTAAGPVITGHVSTCRIGSTIGLGTREDVMPVGREAATRNDIAAFIQCCQYGYALIHAVQIIHILGIRFASPMTS